MSSRIFVDADSCPVKDEIISVASLFQCKVTMVASFDHIMPQFAGVDIVQVDRSDQAADLYIANHIAQHDIIVTQDYGLASIGLGKKAIVLSNRGERYTDETIDYLLARRHIQAKNRRAGKHSKGPKPFTTTDRDKFQQALTNILRDLQDNRIK